MNDEAIRKGGSLSVPSDDLKRILAAAPPTVILAPDAPKFTVIYANPAFCRVSDAKEEELAGRGVLEIFPENPEDTETGNVQALLSSLTACVSLKTETHLPAQKYDIPVRGTREFKTKYWQASNNPVLNAEGEVDYIIHLTVDITGAFELARNERIAFEVAEAKRSELHSIFMEAPAGIVVFKGPELVFKFINPVYRSFFPGANF